MRELSQLQRLRLKYLPLLPPIFRDIHSIELKKMDDHCKKTLDKEIQDFFPFISKEELVGFEENGSSRNLSSTPLKIGVIFSGGQAPGGHNVISGLLDASKKIHPDSLVIGFLNGFKGLMANQFKEITEEVILPYRNQGGFDLIGSDRTKIETPEQFEAAITTFKYHQLDGFVIIGGDDSNTNGAFLSEYCKTNNIPTRIVGVPKTIDGDLKNEWIETSFGFNTAYRIYSELIGNLLTDSLSAKKYYFFIRLMGRSASHITLECALQTHVNLAIISEEVEACNYSLADIVNQIVDLICERSQKNQNYGAILLPEGLLEFIPQCKQMLIELNQLLLTQPSIADQFKSDKDAIQKQLDEHLSDASLKCFKQFPEEYQYQLLLERDAHGNIQLSKIETERLLISLIEKELEKRLMEGIYAGKFSPIPLYFGYEGRSGLPTNFDCNYCYSLGYTAALLIKEGITGCMACIKNLMKPIEEWKPFGVPFVKMLHMELRGGKRKAVIKKALVDLEGPVFAEFKYKREKWRMEDLFISPGPIQFVEE